MARVSPSTKALVPPPVWKPAWKSARKSARNPAGVATAALRSAPIKRFSITTLGCKVNSFESELLAEQLGEWATVEISEVKGNDLIAQRCD